MSVLFITGAGSGVGRAIAQRFGRDGFAVAATGRSMDRLRSLHDELDAGGVACVPLFCDVADKASVVAAVGEAERQLGAIDVLVNNAGIAESAPFVTMDDGLWERTLAVNLTGAYHCMRAVIPGMFARRRGRVINIASTAARVGYAYTAAYVASKHGMLGLTRAVAAEAQGTGVTVNAICPGWIDTDMTQRAITRIVEKTRRTPEEARRTLEQMNPSGRLIPPEAVAAVAAYLASPEADHINGQDLDV